MRSIYRLFFLSIVLFTSVSLVYSQETSKEEKRTLKKARKFLANEDFLAAQTNYLKLLALNSKDAIYNFEGGLSYYFADFEQAKSVPLFEAALENSTKDTIPELYYYLARAYHINGDFEKSKEAFTHFKPFVKTNTKSGQELMKQSDYYIKISDNGNNYLANKNANTIIKNLGASINSSYGEYAPVIKKNDKVLLFTSRRKNGNSKKVDTDLLPYEDIYVAKLVNDNWQLITDKAELEKYIPKDLNTKKHDAGVIYSSDGNTLYTYKNDLIWKSILENGKWSNLVELDKNINSSQYNIPSVNLSKDGNTIYFVSTRKDGFGGKDIYKSLKSEDGKWNEAENLGDKINTKFDEDSPFISDNGKTIYFASKGHDGIGGYDLYKSEITDAGWSKAENMGIPVNSSLDDIYLIIDEEEKNGFFASARDEGLGGMDIYSLCINCPTKITNTINGLLVDNIETPLDGAISIKSLASNNKIETIPSTAGKFTLSTETIGKHEITVESKNFEKQTTTFELPAKSSETDLKIKLNQFQLGENKFQVLTIISNTLNIEKSDTIKLEKLLVENTTNTNSDVNITNNITSNSLVSYQEFYAYNSTSINTSNSQYINLINQALAKAKNGEKIVIEIESSASKVPTLTYKTNINLSSIRGDEAKKTIVQFLIDKGISEDKILVNSINSIVSGPNYSKDSYNLEKYKKSQYVKITLK